MNLIEKYLKETPIKMTEIIDKSDLLFAKIKNCSYDRIILTGSGTSFHSAQQMREYMQRTLGIEVSALYPFMVTDSTFNSFQGKSLVVGISQGGKSFSTYNAMKLARSKGAETASMSGDSNAFIDEAADHILTVHCGEEKAGAKTKGFYCTKLNLMLMALHMAKTKGTLSTSDFDVSIKNINVAIDNFVEVYRQSEEWVEQNMDAFVQAKEIRVIGTSELYGDTLEGALKLLETIRIPVTGYEFEEFIHGIYNAIDADSTLFVIDTGKESRLCKLVELLSEWTRNIYVIGKNAMKDPKHLQLNIMADMDCQTFNFLLPIQIICAKIPNFKGIDASNPKDPLFHMKVGSKKPDNNSGMNNTY